MTRSKRLAVVLVLILICAACSAAPQTPVTTSGPATAPTSSTRGGTPGPTGASSASATSGPASAGPSASATSTPKPSTTPDQLELPGGGREVFPRYRLVGYSGLTGFPTLGRLGTGPLDQRITEMEKRAKPFAAGREILPVVEIIATIVQGSPGRDGKYRSRQSDQEIERYLTAARRHHAILLLNIQPGRSEFIPELKAFEKWLRQPDVGVALDPEWAMDPGQRPGGAYGHTTGAELDESAAYLARLVEQHDLPEKVMVYHQVASSVIRRESGLKKHAGVVLIKSVDGLGPPGPKITTYRVVNQDTPKYVHPGFKLFYTEDVQGGGRLMTPKEVLALKPRPEYVLYE